MKKIISNLLGLALLLVASPDSADAQIAGCANAMDVAINGNFSAGNTGFTSGLAFSPVCGASSYMVANSFAVKCPGTWPNIYDHTFGTAAGSYLIVDGHTTAVPMVIWQQNVTICPNTDYTFAFWAQSLYVAPFSLDYMINGIPVSSAGPILIGPGWTQYSFVWNSGATSGTTPIALRLQNGGAQRDLGIDDIFFGYCNTTTVNSASVCAGGCATLTAGGPAPSFTWSTGATTPSIVVCPGSTTTYTVTGTSPGGCLTFIPATSTVTVISPTVTVSGSTSICPGGSTTLTAIGATTYVWSTGATTSSINVSPASTTTYTVTGTTSGCSSFTTVTVTVNPTPTITATATPATLNPPFATTSHLLTTASGGSGFTYSWSPATGLSSTTAANPVATPTATTVYTVTVTNSGGCYASTTVTVTVTPDNLCTLTYDYDIPAGQSVTSYFGGSTVLLAKNIRIDGNFILDANFDLSHCNVVMQPGSSIQANSGTTLTLADGTHVYSCDSMWQGIDLQSGSKMITTNAVVIEDAINAVKVNQGTYADLEYCTFNRNYTAVNVTANTSGVSPLLMFACVVTSRDIPYTSVIASNPSSSTVWSNIITGTYPSMAMKAPYYSNKSIYGVLATDVNLLQVGSPGAYIANGFDNLAGVGISLTRSNTIVYNNQFRTITNALICPICPPSSGIGVSATGSTAANYLLKIGGSSSNQPNTFTDVLTSVDASNYQVIKVLNNTITNSSTTTSLFGGYGKYGIKIAPSSNNTIDVLDNTITNCATGISINRNNANGISTVALRINTNSVSANASGFCTTAITVIDFAAGTAVVPSPSEITFNTIVESANCISLSDVKKTINVLSNSCMVRYQATGATNGIKAVGCQNLNIMQNRAKYNVTTAGLPGGNILAYGIFMQNSSNITLKCNIMQDAARDFVFDGACSSPNTITQNSMIRAQQGLVLLSSTTVIGTQGSATSASNNYWDVTTVPVHINSSASGTLTLYVNAGTTGTAATQPTVITGPSSINVVVGYTPAACGAVPLRQGAPEDMQEASANESMLIYPNPGNGSFTIETKTIETKNIFVFDVMGKLVLSVPQASGRAISIDITDQPAGIYIVQVVSGNSVETQRVIKQ